MVQKSRNGSILVAFFKIPFSEVPENMKIRKVKKIENLVNHMYFEGPISIRQYLSSVDKTFDDAYFQILSEHLSDVVINEKCISEVKKSRTSNGKRHYGFSL